MKLPALRKSLSAVVPAAAPFVATSALAQSQGYGMMGGNDAGWMGGGYGGIWLILLVIVIAGLVAWIVAQKRK